MRSLSGRTAATLRMDTVSLKQGQVLATALVSLATHQRRRGKVVPQEADISSLILEKEVLLSWRAAPKFRVEGSRRMYQLPAMYL